MIGRTHLGLFASAALHLAVLSLRPVATLPVAVPVSTEVALIAVQAPEATPASPQKPSPHDPAAESVPSLPEPEHFPPASPKRALTPRPKPSHPKLTQSAANPVAGTYGPTPVTTPDRPPPVAPRAVPASADYLQNPPPSYPDLARRLRHEGVVILNVTVSTSGTVEAVSIKQGSGFKELDASAESTVRTWHFRPGKLGDLPVRSEVEVPIRFHLQRLSG